MISIYKWRLFYVIFSSILLLTLIYFVIKEQIDYNIFFIIIVFSIFLHVYFQKYERKKALKIHLIYLHDLNPLVYLEEYQKFNKKRFLSKSAKLISKINCAIVLLTAGKLEKSHQVLLELVDLEPKFGPYLRFWYYTAWINYYDEVDDLQRMKFLLEQNKIILKEIPAKYRQKLVENYEFFRAKCLVKEGVFLDTAENFFLGILRGNLPKLTILNCIYQLGLIAYKNRQYDLSKRRLLSVVTNGKDLNEAKKAKTILEKIDKLSS